MGSRACAPSATKSNSPDMGRRPLNLIPHKKMRPGGGPERIGVWGIRGDLTGCQDGDQ